MSSLPHDEQLLGLYVTARAARAVYDGVVLPAPARSRTGRMRLACDDGRVLPLDPAWVVEPHGKLARDRGGKVLALTQRVAGRPSYRYGDLPAQHLATKTMLGRELRAKPAAGQRILAWYRLHRDWAPLYAVADAENLTPLPPSRAAAWRDVRTCCRCRKQFGSPLVQSPEPQQERYCAPCHDAAATERWIDQVRPVQVEMAAWAREVLADPRTVLAAKEPSYSEPIGYHVEDVAGRVLLSANVRRLNDAELARCSAQIQQAYAGSVYAGDLIDAIRHVSQRRIITWFGTDISELSHGLWPLLDTDKIPSTHGDPVDRLIERYRLWCAVHPGYKSGFWYPEPKMPWSNGSTRANVDAETGYRTAQTAQDRVRWLRIYLERMATEQPPEPSIGIRGAV